MMKKMVIALALSAATLYAPVASAQAVPPAGSMPGLLAGTGLTAGAAAAIVGGIIVLGVVISDNGTVATDTY